MTAGEPDQPADSRNAEAQPLDFGIGILFWRVREAVVVADVTTGRIVLWNPAAETLFGYQAAEAVGMPIERLIPPELLERHRAGMARYRATGHGPLIDGNAVVELTALRRSGEVCTVDLSLSTLEAEPHATRYVLAVIRDATERKRAEEERIRRIQETTARAEAEATQRQLAFLAEASRVLASSLDAETILAQVTRLAVPAVADACLVDLVELDDEVGAGPAPRRVAVAHVDPQKEAVLWEIQRRYPMQLHHPRGTYPAVVREGRGSLVPEVADAFLVRIAYDAEHLTLLRALEMRSYMLAPLVARGRTLGVMSFLAGPESGRRYAAADMTLAEDLARRCALAIDNARLYAEAQVAVDRERAARADAEAANRAKDVFLSTAAHELKTPLTAMKAYVQLLQRTLAPHAHDLPGEALAVLDRQYDRLRRLVEELLDVSRLALGRLELRRERLDLTALIAEVVTQVQATTTRHQLRLQAAAPAVVDADRDRLEQVLVNLLHNAVKFSPAGGAITVQVTQEDGTAVVTVQDPGIGIPAEHHGQIFTQFFQAHVGTSHDYGGTGIGLHLSREFVVRHGGTMWFTSEEGRGSRFAFCLPLAEVRDDERQDAGNDSGGR